MHGLKPRLPRDQAHEPVRNIKRFVVVNDKQPVQADGAGTVGRKPDFGVASRRGGVGESGGRAYFNPYRHEEGARTGSAMSGGTAGQSGALYEGSGNPNSTPMG